MEKAHDISLDEPTVAHQAILFMLDVLMRNDNQALSIAQLYDSFGDKSFTPQMLRAVGGNEQGLKQFLQRYPSLFSVIGDSVIANSGNSMRSSSTPERYLKRNKSKEDELSSVSGANGNGNPSPFEAHDSKTMKEIEQEAMAFFKKQMSKREEDWLHIVSVAGHASQSSSDIRKFVGPQNEFKNFLQRYPHVFVVRDDYCGLKGRAEVSTAPFPPPSPPPKRRVLAGSSALSRTQSFKNRYSNGVSLATMSSVSQSTSISGAGGNVNMSKPRLTPVEVKAVHYVMRILHKQGRMLLQNIPGLISRAPDHVSNCVGFTREDLIQFFKRHSAIFQLHPDGCVSVKQDAIKALILKEQSFADSAAVFTSLGTVLRIFPKYGILNLDNNEQVFFDIQSCHFETFSDLTTILHPGDRLCFNAVIGPRDGSTKWRSLKTWIKTKETLVANMMIGDDNLSSEADKSDDSSSNGCNSMNGSTNSTINNLSNAQAKSHQAHNTQTNNSLVSPANSVTNIEDFNQYQLDIGDFSDADLQQPQVLSSAENSNLHCSSSLLSISQQLAAAQGKSSQATSLNEDDFNRRLSLVQHPAALMHHQLSTGSHHSGGAGAVVNGFSMSALSASKSTRDLVNMNPLPINHTQLILTQASDNISKREVCSSSSNLVSMGCQTVSTGEIMATNIYIE